MFHNRGSIIAQSMLYTLKMTLSGSESRRGIAPGPPVVGAALHWLHSLSLPLLFTIIFHHSDWAGYNPELHNRPLHTYICYVINFMQVGRGLKMSFCKANAIKA